MMTGPLPPSPAATTDADPPTGPIGVVANVIGICAAGVALFTPAVAFAQLGAMGAAGFILALAAGHRERRTPVLGLLGGIAAMMAAVALYQQYQDAVDQLGQFGGL